MAKKAKKSIGYYAYLIFAKGSHKLLTKCDNKRTALYTLATVNFDSVTECGVIDNDGIVHCRLEGHMPTAISAIRHMRDLKNQQGIRRDMSHVYFPVPSSDKVFPSHKSVWKVLG